MTETDVQIERLVREVMRRLRVAESASPAPAPPSNPPARSRAAELVLEQRVISLAALDGRLESGIQRLVVARDAVITPSVRDELRARGIGLAYVKAHDDGNQSDRMVALATWHTRFDPAALAEQISGDGYCVRTVDTTGGFKSFMNELRGDDPRGPQLGVVLTDRPAAALCLANRPPHFRAVWGVDRPSIEEAFPDIAPNILVLQPMRDRPPMVADMVRIFLRGGGGECPAGIRDEL